MTRKKLIIEGELPSLNEYINAERTNKYAGATIKRNSTMMVLAYARKSKLEAIMTPVVLLFKWYMKDRRKDIDNVAFAKKFILDGLVKAGILYDDNQKWVKGFQDKFYIDKKKPRIEVSFLTPR